MCHVDVTGVHLISIPAPPRGATDGSAPSRRILKFQFTPLREGRPFVPVTPVLKSVFQFPPLREGRRKSSTLNRRKSLFQFPPLREGRHKQLVTKGDADVISIHAPPRGATQQVAHMQHNAQFQFTPLREGRHVLDSAIQRGNLFQFTPLREGRQCSRLLPGGLHTSPTALHTG